MVNARPDHSVFYDTIFNGNLESIKNQYFRGYDFDGDELFYAASQGQLEIVRFFQESRVKRNPHSTSNHAMDAAIINGHLDVVKYFHKELGATFSMNAMNSAIKNGYTEVVKYLNEEVKTKCYEYAFDWTINNKDLPILRYLHDKINAECSANAINQAFNDGNFKLFRYIHDEMRITCGMRWMYCTPNEEDVSKNKPKKILEYVHVELKEKCDMEMDLAAKNGDLKTLRQLRRNGKQCSENAMIYAAEKGYLDVVQFLYEEMYADITETAVECAVFNGHLPVVKYFRDNGVELTEFMIDLAIGKPEMVQYLLANK